MTILAIAESSVNALITAVPTTLVGIVSLIVLRKGQLQTRAIVKETALAVDGKISQLLVAEKGVARAEGAAQERSEERERVAEAVPIVTAAIAQAAVEAVKADPDKISKMEIVNQDENAVPMRLAEPKEPTK